MERPIPSASVGVSKSPEALLTPHQLSVVSALTGLVMVLLVGIAIAALMKGRRES